MVSYLRLEDLFQRNLFKENLAKGALKVYLIEKRAPNEHNERMGLSMVKFLKYPDMTYYLQNLCSKLKNMLAKHP